jgi:hypothetical protein
MNRMEQNNQNPASILFILSILSKKNTPKI